MKVGTIISDNVRQIIKRGDYSMIESFTVGHDKEADLEEDTKDIVERKHIIEGHPIESSRWRNLRILTYYEVLQELENKKGKS